MTYTKILLFAALMLTASLGARFALFDCDVFTVDNESSYGLGDVGIVGPGSTGDIEVPDTGVYSDTLCFTPAAILIAGQACLYPDTAVVTLASGSAVQVTWQSPQFVGIKDKELRDGPR